MLPLSRGLRVAPGTPLASTLTVPVDSPLPTNTLPFTGLMMVGTAVRLSTWMAPEGADWTGAPPAALGSVPTRTSECGPNDSTNGAEKLPLASTGMLEPSSVPLS
jgi:hypothetical protein